MLNEGRSAIEIYKVLNTVKRFKDFLPKEAPKAGFKVPEPVLGKRKEPENGNLAAISHTILQANALLPVNLSESSSDSECSSSSEA
jgi:hypothetical protein